MISKSQQAEQFDITLLEQINFLRSTIEKELCQIQEYGYSYPTHNNCKISVEYKFIKKVGFD